MTCFRQEYSLGGVQMKRIGGHSVGSSIALFRYRNAPYLIAGDECYAYENIREKQPPANPYRPRHRFPKSACFPAGEWRILLSHQPGGSLLTEQKNKSEGR